MSIILLKIWYYFAETVFRENNTALNFCLETTISYNYLAKTVENDLTLLPLQEKVYFR